jgi:Family of unknown function (DUF5684)
MHFALLDSTSGTDTTTQLIVDLVFLAIVVFYVAAEWRIFSKAGKPGWAALIPIYSTFVFLSVVGRSAVWFLLLLIPFANIIFAIILVNDLSKSFGRGIGTTLGLLFLSPIFIPILGFGKAQYVGPAAAQVPVAAYR